MKPQENKETANDKRAELEEQLTRAKEHLKEYDTKTTFKGLYNNVCGRKNILRVIRDSKDNKELSQQEMYKKGVVALKKFVDGLE